MNSGRQLILELARRLREAELVDAAERLEGAYDREVRVIGLDVDEREAILRALEDGPGEFSELRAVLLQEHTWRAKEGL